MTRPTKSDGRISARHLRLLGPTLAALVFLLASTFAAPRTPSSFSVTFPDRGDYSFWICSAAGDVTTTPITARNHDGVDIPVTAHAGDDLYVLDLSTGRIAVVPLNVDNFGRVAPIDMLPSDFTQLARGDGLDKPVLLGHSTDTSSTSPGSPDAGQDDWAEIALAFVLGALLSAAGGWFAVRIARRNLMANLMPEPTVTRSRIRNGNGDAESVDIAPVPSIEPVRVSRFGDRPGRRRKPRGVPYLIGTQGVVAGSRFVLNTPRITIGREDENDIAISDNTISRHHATFIRGDNGVYAVVDEESANGIYVNAMRTQRAILQPGDEIKIGDCYFRYEAG